MALGGELFVLVLYISQQAGVMLGVGAETVLLCAYLLGLRAPTETHDAHVRAARFAQRFGLAVMVASGLGAVVLHASTQQLDVLLAPAFIFKWILIGVVLVLYAVERATEERLSGQGGIVVQALVRGIAGGNWYALFLVHSAAPVVSWEPLLLLYAAWMAAFGVLWAAFVYLMHPSAIARPRAWRTPQHMHTTVVPQPKLHVAAQPAPRAPLPAIVHEELDALHALPKVVQSAAPQAVTTASVPKPPVHPAAATAPVPPKEEDALRPILIMPKTPEELAAQRPYVGVTI